MVGMDEFFEGASLVVPYEASLAEPDTRSLEEIMAEQRGGDPIDYLPFATQIRESIVDTGVAAAISPKPIGDEDPIFAGHHEIVLMTHSAIYGDIERRIYVTPDQLRKGDGTLKLPREGLFVRDEDQSWSSD